ncbi:MAG: T9SS type A sorting domain-containing protein [Bacteroidia bacterium]|nr:T9SS type A sorting domain-containing protein [Bacteroidia bacterium]
MKSLFILPLFFFIYSLQAQNYHPIVENGKLWSIYHVYGNPMDPFSLYNKFTDDTVFAGYTWKKVVSSRDSVVLGWSRAGFMREDPDHRVYFKNSIGSITWLYYDFNLSIGDTINPYDPDTQYVLDSITSFELLDGEFRNRYVLRFINPFGGLDSCYTYWIEGIGSMHGLLQPVMCLLAGDNPALICYWEDDVLKYHNPDFPECYVVTGIRDSRSMIRDILIYPNPAKEILSIEFKRAASTPIIFELFDLCGNLAIRQTLEHPKTKLSLNDTGVAPGLYLYRISEKEGVIKTGKLLRH